MIRSMAGKCKKAHTEVLLEVTKQDQRRIPSRLDHVK